MSKSLQPYGLQPFRHLCLWDFSSMNTGVGSHFLVQGIFLTQGSSWHRALLCLLHYRWNFCCWVLEGCITLTLHSLLDPVCPWRVLRYTGDQQMGEDSGLRGGLDFTDWEMNLTSKHKEMCDTNSYVRILSIHFLFFTFSPLLLKGRSRLISKLLWIVP